MSSLFEKIISRELPAKIVYEDDMCIAIEDINPQAPTHVLLIPKKMLERLSDATNEHHDMLGDLMTKVPVVMQKLGIMDDYRIVINNGPGACQTVFHLHIHLLAGRPFAWPPG